MAIRGEDAARGRAGRKVVPRSSHADWSPATDRPDPVDVITSQNEDRLQWLVPIRHWRMAQSPFAFYRGAAKLMALDLSSTPDTGIRAQICGDAHVSNFGAYGSPERALVFDLNDFDETLPGPWEWDVKRLAVSFVIAARHNDMPADDGAAAAAQAARSYQGAMRRLARMGYLDAWYTHLDVDEIYDAVKDEVSKKDRKRVDKFVRKARTKDSLHALNKLAEKVDGSYQIKAQPPLLVPIREVVEDVQPEGLRAELAEAFKLYLDSVPDHVEKLLERFSYRDFAIKVVGVGSVGTRCFIVLLEGRDEADPLFLQIKQATRSVLEDHLPASAYHNHGRRVVEGQRLMQAASDSFLGWTQSVYGHHYYWRQLKDMKASLPIETAGAEQLRRWAHLSGATLARAHARSGVAAEIAGYLGKNDNFAEAMVGFAAVYADQNELDYAAFTSAIADGRIDAHEET